MSIQFNSSDFINRIEQLNNRMLHATRLYAETSGAQLESYAKANEPWKYITGISRNTISHEVKSDRYRQTIILRGGVSAHFPYLELGFEGRYSIIDPTMIKLAPGIVTGWRRVIGV